MSNIKSSCCDADVWNVKEEIESSTRLSVLCWQKCDKCQKQCSVKQMIYFSKIDNND